MTKAEKKRIADVLRRARYALVDLGACDDPRCTDSACLHALPKVRALPHDLTEPQTAA